MSAYDEMYFDDIDVEEEQSVNKDKRRRANRRKKTAQKKKRLFDIADMYGIEIERPYVRRKQNSVADKTFKKTSTKKLRQSDYSGKGNAYKKLQNRPEDY